MAAEPSTTTTGPAAPALAGLVAVLTVLTLELVRSSGPLLDLTLSSGGLGAVARATAITYAAPGLVVALLLLVSRATPHRPESVTLLLGSALLGVLRLVVQGLDGSTRFGVGLITVAVAIAVLTLAVALLAGRAGGGRCAAAALALGASAGVGLQLALGTWDAYWRHTWLGWTVTVLLVALLVGLAVSAVRDPATGGTRQVGRLWGLGPLLALSAMMLANPAFAASQSGVPLVVAGPLHAAGLLVAAVVAMRSGVRAGGTATRSRPWSWTAGLLLGVAAALVLGGLSTFDGAFVLLALLGGQAAAVSLLARALEPPPGQLDHDAAPTSGPLSSWAAGTAAVIGLTTILPLLIYQIDYNVPLGLPNEVVLLVASALLAGAGVRRPDGASDLGAGRGSARTLVAATTVVVLTGSILAVAAAVGRTAGAPGAARSTGRVLSWNLHYGVGPSGDVGLEAIARTIEQQDPDVVLLQEVSRGWVLGSGVDVATWLSQRLDRPFVFAPAADRRFGNVILARDVPTDVQIQPLPYGEGPQERSAVSARVLVGGVPMRVTSVHLQQHPWNAPTRVLQVRALLSALRPLTGSGGRSTGSGGPSTGSGGGGPEIVGGDLNARPGTPEIELLTGAGFVSALDTAGAPAALTSPSVRPRQRIDWILGRGVVFAEARVLDDALYSDHLPLVADVTAIP